MRRKIILYATAILILLSTVACNSAEGVVESTVETSSAIQTETVSSRHESSSVESKEDNSILSSAITSSRYSASSKPKENSSKQHSSAASSQIEISSQASSVLASQPLPPEKKELIAGEEVDFVFSFPKGTDIKILQLSDLQIGKLDLGETCRDTAFHAPFATDTENILWRYVREAVERADPDLIILAGDIVEGVFDDNGADWLDVCRHMDGYKIPWLVVFGNHDRESLMGVRWQIEQVRNTDYGVATPIKEEIPGCNYSVALKEGDQYKYILWIMDTHGSGSEHMLQSPDMDLIYSEYTIFNRQITWMQETNLRITNKLGEQLPSLMFMHVPPIESLHAVRKKYRTTYSKFPFVPNLEGDFGRAEELPGGFASRIFSSAKEIGCVGMFFAHQHQIAMSVMYEGVRLTWGLKTGRYSYIGSSMVGSTLITIDDQRNAFMVRYLYSHL